MGKILRLKEFIKLRNQFNKESIVLVGGCFELLHYGHIQFLTQAKKAGDLLVVALEPDVFIREKKKRQPVHDENQRAQMLSSINAVDYVIILPQLRHDDDYTKLVEDLKPGVIAITKGDPYTEIKKNQAKQINAKVVEVIKRLPGLSTSSIISYASISRN